MKQYGASLSLPGGPIALFPLGVLKSLKGCEGLALSSVLIQTNLARAADPSPASNQNDISEQIPLDLEGVETAHVLGRVDLTQRDGFCCNFEGSSARPIR